ncbi:MULTISPECIES: histidine triad nucleotide-binding protein [Ramlibacter]|uniref:HIT domain-containing protein n=1 Tax=Ramlibacter pinisoli TaxID=2682844 RepID=A0A6N8J2H4_9BURK|nr:MULTISPECIES: histidine triad nucleotide-binding protein [Ramlibacter]MBA2962548.1 histidine triad nucleotide-binding protein [Ramlibacter sp. CGMCC 1.13660]MVQ32490.1 HIT domain-containing protein [Ramlibacter pinisoli]
MSHDPNCLFCKIVQGAIPARKVYEDDDILAFHDIHPWAPVHFLMIPKQHLPSLAQVTEQHAPMLGRMLALAPKLALQEGCRPYPDGGHRVIINTGAEGGQEVHHLHIHVIGGPRPWLKG